MQFIEMSGKTLARIISDDELSPEQLAQDGVSDESVVHAFEIRGQPIHDGQHHDNNKGTKGNRHDRQPRGRPMQKIPSCQFPLKHSYNDWLKGAIHIVKV